MHLFEAQDTIRSIARAMGMDADRIDVTVKPFRGEGSRSYAAGNVIATAEGMRYRFSGPLSRERVIASDRQSSAELALAQLVDLADDAALDYMQTADREARKARAEELVAKDVREAAEERLARVQRARVEAGLAK